MQNAINVEQLRKHYGQVEALKGIDLHVRRGEIFGLLGANGAGKSTLIRTLVGATKPTGGTVRVLDLDPAKQAHDLRPRIGFMPQSPALYEDLSPRDNVRFFARAHGVNDLERRIDDILAFTDLRDREHDPIYGFSGGMKQRVSLSCALLHEPELLLLDEPTAGVDPKLRAAFWSYFRSLAAQGVTILVSTHQMDEVLHCDRVAVMRAGSVLACDTPRGLLARGKSTVTIWRNGSSWEQTVENISCDLPDILGVSTTIERIDIQQETLEDVVLHLIEEKNHA